MTPLVAGKYRLTRLLGRGGMGSVWEGVHETLGTRVAVKLIDIEYVQSGDSRRRFETEARAAAKLQSKHVVEVYDYGVTPEGQPFIVMQYLAGEPLDRRLERLGRLSAPETARIVLGVCKALARAHTAGIVHRDLKPENVFIVRDEEDGTELVKVVDFGIAKIVGDQPQDSATRTGSVLGTPFYMSPEQARGLRSVDHRSDLWSVAVIAFRCMVGRLPFEGEAVGDLLVNLCTGPIPIPSVLATDLPPGFDGWMARALSRNPAERFATAAELGEALAALCGLSARVGPITSEIPILGADSQDIGFRITAPAPKGETMAEVAMPRGATPLSVTPMPASTTYRSPSGLTGSAMANTPPPQSRQNTSTLIVATALTTLIVVVGVAALLRLTGQSHEAPPPAVAAPAIPAAHVPPPAAAPAVPAAAQPSEAQSAEAKPAFAPPVPPASAQIAPSASAAARTSPVVRNKASPQRNTPQPNPSPQSLEIRLQR